MVDISKNWKTVCLFVVLFACLKFLISYVVLSSFSRVIVDVEFDHNDVIDVYYSAGDHFIERYVASTPVMSSSGRQRVSVDLGENIARRVRIDLGRRAGEVKIYSLEFRSYFGEPVVLNSRDIYDLFTPNEGVGGFELRADYVFLRTVTNDPFLKYSGPDLKYENVLFGAVLPAILAFTFSVLITSVNFLELPAVKDIGVKTSSIGVNVAGLDGLRGLAALMVLAEHSGVLKGIGALGVWIFFALSGFLLATPFARAPRKAVSWKAMKEYALRRIKRILPMYYTFLTGALILGNGIGDFSRHILFVQGDGHLWTIPQEMLFYSILPFIVFPIYYLLKIGKPAILLFLLLITWGTREYLGIGAVSLYGYGRILRFHIYIFMGGMFFAYLYQYIIEIGNYKRLNTDIVKRISSVSGLILLFALILFSTRKIPSLMHFTPVYEPFTFGLLTGLLVFLVVFSKESWLNDVMTFIPFRAVGIVSFSFYLIHPKIYFFLKEIVFTWSLDFMRGWPIFLASWFMTYLVSAFTYSYIERPFLKSSVRKKAVKV